MKDKREDDLAILYVEKCYHKALKRSAVDHDSTMQEEIKRILNMELNIENGKKES